MTIPTLILPILIVLLLVPLMTIPPEGAFRSGVFLPLILLWSLLLPPLVWLQRSTKDFFLKNGEKTNRFCRVDAVVLACCFTWLLSLFLLGLYDQGNWRYGVNMFWTCCFFPILYATIRLLRPYLSLTTLFCILGIVLAVALGESFLSLYGYAIRDPAIREQFMADPDGMLLASGFNYPVGSPERILMENRILGSTEPLGSYGLTNTLAGVLAPWTFLLSSAGILILFAKKENLRTIGSLGISNVLGVLAVLFVLYLPLMITLLLTKSRSGVLALLGGYTLLFAALLFRWRQRTCQRQEKRLLSLLGLTIMLLGTLAAICWGAFTLGILDREVFTEAGKSLGYRLQYWQSSLKMMVDYPFFGVGPGNFQTIYPQYMLPNAAEVIADPHNFVFEIAVVYGIPSLLVFLLLVGSLILAPKKLWSREITKSSVEHLKCGTLPQNDSPNRTLPHQKKAIIILSFGGGIGYLFALVYSWLTEVPLDIQFVINGFLAVGIVAGLLTATIRYRGEKLVAWWQQNHSERLLLMLGAIMVLLINLGAAGGIFYPPVAITFWLFAALIVNETLDGLAPVLCDNKRRVSSRSSLTSHPSLLTKDKGDWLIVALFTCMIPISLYLTGVSPVHRGQYLHDVAYNKLINGNYLSDEFVRSFEQKIAKVDPYSLPLQRLRYDMALQMTSLAPGPIYEKEFLRVRNQLLTIAPNNAALRESLGEGELTLYEKYHRKIFLDHAKEALTYAATKAPFDAKKKGLLAKALYLSGQLEEAKKIASEALHLSDNTPHLDRKLSEQLRLELEKVISD